MLLMFLASQYMYTRKRGWVSEKESDTMTRRREGCRETREEGRKREE